MFVSFTCVYVTVHSSPFCSWQIPYCQITLYMFHVILFDKAVIVCFLLLLYTVKISPGTLPVFSMIVCHLCQVVCAKENAGATVPAHVIQTCRIQCAANMTFCKPSLIMNLFHNCRNIWSVMFMYQYYSLIVSILFHFSRDTATITGKRQSCHIGCHFSCHICCVAHSCQFNNVHYMHYVRCCKRWWNRIHFGCIYFKKWYIYALACTKFSIPECKLSPQHSPSLFTFDAHPLRLLVRMQCKVKVLYKADFVPQ